MEKGLVTPDMLEQALARARATGERNGESFVALGAVAAEDALRALARQHQLAYLSRDELPSPLPILKNLSPKYLRQYTVCPVSVEGGLLTAATADPLNPLILDDLQSARLVVKRAQLVEPFDGHGGKLCHSLSSSALESWVMSHE